MDSQDENSVEGKPPDPPINVWCSGGQSVNPESLSDLLLLAPETQEAPTPSFIPETCPLPSSQGNFIPETCPITSEVSSQSPTTQRSMILEGRGSSEIDNLLEAPIGEIPSNMVAPLLGSIYDASSIPQNKDQFSPPRNYTLASTGKRCVILIQPLGQNGRDLLYDPILTNELIYDRASKYNNKYAVKDLRINKVKGIIAVEYASTVPLDFLGELTAGTLLGEYPIKSYIPNSDLFSVGTISPVSLRLSTEKIRQHLKIVQGLDSVKIIKVERLKKREPDATEVRDSETIKVTFSSAEPPRGVSLCGSFYKTRPYVPFPVQCWKCQRLGHTSGSCKSTSLRCRKCAGNHQKKDCTSNVMKCANCSQPHNANSRDCRFIQKAYKAEKEKVLNKNKLSVCQLAPEISSKRNWPSLSNPHGGVSEQPDTPRPLYSQVAAVSMTEAVRAESGLPNANQKCSCSCGGSIAGLLDKEFFEKLKNFVLDIFSMISKGEDSNSRSLLADSAIQNNFGVDMSATAIHKTVNTVEQLKTLERNVH